MLYSIKRYGIAFMVVAMAVFFVFSDEARQSVLITAVARAGDITSPAWTVSSTTASATDVTYTHTFTTTTAIPASTGRIEIHLDTNGSPPPDFSKAKIASGTTTALANQTLEIIPDGFAGMVLGIQNGSAAVAAGSVTIKLSGITNPGTGTSYTTNTYTLSSGQALDGKKGPDSNGVLAVGSLSLTVTVKDSNNLAVANYPLEVHPQACCGNWRAKTNANGQALFYGIASGTYVLEQSHAINPSSSNSSTISQYVAFDPATITLPADAAKSVTVTKSSKTISVTVTQQNGTAVKGANVNSFSMDGGGFSFAQTDSSGKATLRMAVKNANSNIMVMVMPAFGPPPGQGQPPSQNTDFVAPPPTPVSFVKGATEAEDVALALTVKKPNATVTGKVVKPDGTPVTVGGAGAMNFRAHQFQPLFFDSSGNFSFKAVAGMGDWELNYFDPSGSFAMPKTRFTVKEGTNNLGTITLKAFDGSITVKTLRVDSGADVAVPGVPIMAFEADNPGPPTMGFTGSDGIASIKVSKGVKYRVMANPASSGGPGQHGGEGTKAGGPGKTAVQDTLWKLALADWAYAQTPPAGPSGAADANQLFPITPSQKGQSGDTVTIKFDKATIQLTVATKDSAGTLITDGGFVNCRPSGAGNFFGGGFGAPSAGGSATVYVTKGNLSCSAFFSPDSQYSGKETAVNNVTGNQTVTLTVVKKTVTVTGEIQDGSSGNAKISGDALRKLNLMIGAFWPGGMGMGAVNVSAGTYTVKAPFDTDVNVGVAPSAALFGEASDYIPSISAKTLKGTDGQTVTFNLTLAKIDATINVTVKDADGKAIEGITVSANNKLADIVGKGEPGGGPGPGIPSEGPEFGFSAVTDANGLASIRVAPDTYNLAVNARGKGLFATQVVNTTIKSGETKAEAISLVKPDATVEVTVSKGTDGSALNGATAGLFNDKGTIALAVKDGSSGDIDGTVNGKVKVKVPADTYTVSAGLDAPESGTVDQSGTKKVVAAKDTTSTLTLSATHSTDALAAPATQDVSSSSPATIELSKGGAVDASLAIPTGALSSGSSGSDSSSSSSTSTTVTAVPLKAEASSTKSDTVIKGMEISALDSSGNSVTTLSSQATVTIKYADNDIPTGLTETQFVSRAEIKSFSEDTGNWEALTASDCNKDTNTCTATTNHLTTFAVVAATDTTAPAAPTSVTATNAGNNSVKVAWTKPTDSDFASVTVLRSTASGTQGSAVKTGVKDASFTDTGLTNGTKYYYTVHSVDTTGNESTNTDQYSVVISTLPKTGTPKTNPVPLGVIALVAVAFATWSIRRLHA